MNKIFKLSMLTATALILSACGGSDSDVDRSGNTGNNANSNTVNILAPQNAPASQLFYGNSKHSGLGSLSNTMVINPKSPSTKIVEKSNMNINYPMMSSSLTYAGDNNYSNFHLESINYVSNNNAYRVSMAEGGSEVTSGSETNLIGTGRRGAFSYKTLSYLGTKQYIKVANQSGDELLIAPQMTEMDTPLSFTDKTLMTLAYPSYGEAVNGYIVFDSNKSQLQNCTIDMTTCTDIESFTSMPTFIGDIGGTVHSIISSNNIPYILDKSLNSVTAIAGITLPPKVGHGTPYTVNGSSIYYIENHNITKVDLDGTLTQLSTDGNADGFKAFTDDMVIYGGDDYMYAVKKDGSLKDAAIEISFTTKTRGQKYPFDLAIGKQYLYTLYSVNIQTGKTTFSACKLEDAETECRSDAYWSAVTAAVSGTLNHESTYKYTPYSYVRVDTTDNYGGGKVKAIDPLHPLEDGISMGEIENYNFQTFVNSRYDNDMIDSNGSIILYAKNDLDYRGDAFLMNLHEENSLINLTNEAAPTISELTVGRDHCHGRKCTVCHSFAGGKIYNDKNGTSSAKGYTIRFDFEDGSTSILAKIRKGSGENFSIPLEGLVGKNFKAVVVDANNTVEVQKSMNYYHKGIEYFNCNYCHGRRGDLKYDAPHVITIED